MLDKIKNWFKKLKSRNGKVYYSEWFDVPRNKQEFKELHYNPVDKVWESRDVVKATQFVDEKSEYDICEDELDTLTLLKHQLGSIDLKDLEMGDMSESERKEYVASINAIYPRLEKDTKKMLHEQLMFMSTEAENWDQIIFGRGTFNGIDLLLNHWKKASNEHEERLKPEDKFDRHELMPKIDE